MKTFLLFLITIPATRVANAQNAPIQPKFEVASVKRTDRCFTGNSSIDPGSVTLKGVPLKGVLMEAFKVKMELIEGPSWLETDCVEISAKFPEGATKDQLPAMLQVLLAERFKLVAHKEDRPRSGYALVVEKGGPKFKEADPKTNFMGKDARPGLTLYGAFGHGRLKGVMTMAKLVSNLSTQGYGPVQDATGLTGSYDIDLTWAPDQAFEPGAGDATASAATPPVASIPAGEAHLFTALRESLGLKLEHRSVQVQFVVIDHVERIPNRELSCRVHLDVSRPSGDMWQIHCPIDSSPPTFVSMPIRQRTSSRRSRALTRRGPKLIEARRERDGVQACRLPVRLETTRSSSQREWDGWQVSHAAILHGN